jgi:hypothetical protein
MTQLIRSKTKAESFGSGDNHHFGPFQKIFPQYGGKGASVQHLELVTPIKEK